MSERCLLDVDAENISLAHCLLRMRSDGVAVYLLLNVAEPVVFGAVMGHEGQGSGMRILLTRQAMYV